MDFLTFFLYFLGCMTIRLAFWSVVEFFAKKYMRYKFEKAIKSGKIKVVTMKDLVEQSEEGDQTWN